MSLAAGLKSFLGTANAWGPVIAGGRISPLRLPRNWKPVKGLPAVTFERAGGGRLEHVSSLLNR